MPVMAGDCTHDRSPDAFRNQAFEVIRKDQFTSKWIRGPLSIMHGYLSGSAANVLGSLSFPDWRIEESKSLTSRLYTSLLLSYLEGHLRDETSAGVCGWAQCHSLFISARLFPVILQLMRRSLESSLHQGGWSSRRNHHLLCLAWCSSWGRRQPAPGTLRI